MKLKFCIFIAIIISSLGCASRNLVYFSDLDASSGYSAKIDHVIEPKIQRGDLLKITVSSLNPESNLLFNVGVLNSNDEVRMNPADALNEGYLVNTNGEINFPVLGVVNLQGKTKEEATDTMKEMITEYVKDPIVNISFLNFKVTVIGEVNKPGSFILDNDRISLIEALGLAGDMTQFGKRENVLIIRDEGGERKANRVNLNNKEFLNSPYYMLHQNDVVYVEPDKMKAIQASTNQRALTTLGILASLSVAILFNLRFLLTN